MTYLRRQLDERLVRVLEVHPACLVEGIRGVGKTSTAERAAQSVLRLDDPRVAEVVTRDPEAAFGSRPRPLLIDEWQRVPTVWDAVRRMVDADRAPSTPERWRTDSTTGSPQCRSASWSETRREGPRRGCSDTPQRQEPGWAAWAHQRPRWCSSSKSMEKQSLKISAVSTSSMGPAASKHPCRSSST